MNYAVCDIEKKDCMLQKCSKCRGEIGVKTFLEGLKSVENAPNTIYYKQWTSTDRCTLSDISENLDSYLNSLSKKIVKLTRHHFIAKEQASYLKKLKQSLTEVDVIIIGDFSENYSFVVQDSVQGFHWENSQCTIHPFIMYYIRNGVLYHQSFCFLSDDLKHTPAMVYTFISKLITKCKEIVTNISKIHYFSDGCAAQYKNKYNFINLCYHRDDFNLDGEWNFFATSHGKNACDGLGGTVKRSLTKASLQRTVSEQIIKPIDAYNYCIKKLSQKIIFFYIEGKEIKKVSESLFKRFSKATLIKGTQKLHRFRPLNTKNIAVYETSSDENFKIIDIAEGKVFDINLNIEINNYIACIYDSELWIGIVEDHDEYYNDYKINFLKPSGIKEEYSFPEKADRCLVQKDNILSVLNDPKLVGGSRIKYSFDKKELKDAFKLFNSWNF
jgi:hypothetical protein